MGVLGGVWEEIINQVKETILGPQSSMQMVLNLGRYSTNDHGSRELEKGTWIRDAAAIFLERVE